MAGSSAKLEAIDDENVRKRRISGIREADEEEHTRPTTRPPADVAAELIARASRHDDDWGTMPGTPSRALLAAEDEAAIEAARALYTQAEHAAPPALPADDFQELIELLEEDIQEEDPFGGLIPIEEAAAETAEPVDEYGSFDPNAVPSLGTWSELGRLCLGGRAVMVLGLIDGKSTIAKIVEGSGLPVSEVIGIFKVLVEHGAVDLG
jgi:hypothetical protein